MSYSASKVFLSSARNVLQARALQCSFSSVFHLRKAGLEPQKADFVENVFVATVAGPLIFMGSVGLVSMIFREDSVES